MIELKNKFAIGCFVQWYEVELVDEYIQSVRESLIDISNRKNVIVDICFNMSQTLEKIDKSQMKLDDIFQRFLEIRNTTIAQCGIDSRVSFYPNHKSEWDNTKLKPYTIADYRRDFNERYCEEVDVLMWGETDSLIPKQTFEVLDNLHDGVKEETPKYITFFGTCKMWDDSWRPVEHVDFTNKPFGGEYSKEWYGTRYNMSLDEMNKINNKVDELDVGRLNQFKFNGFGLVISSDIVKCGANIPKSVFFTHEDTAFMHQVNIMFGNDVPQYVIKNILLVHNRNHTKKRLYILDETGNDIGEMRKSNDWFKEAAKLSEFNAYNFNKQQKLYTWRDVWKNIK